MSKTIRLTAIAAATTAAVFLEGKKASAGLRLAGGGSGSIEYTLSHRSLVEAGTALWKVSAPGVVSADIDINITSPVTAIRAVSAVGAIVFEIVIA